MKIDLKLSPLSVDAEEIYGTLEGVKTLRKIEDGRMIDYAIVEGEEMPLAAFEDAVVLTPDNKVSHVEMTGAQLIGGRVRVYVDGMEEDEIKALKKGSVPRLFVGAAPAPAPKNSKKKEAE